jgi:glycosidase
MAMLVPLDFWREARTALDKTKEQLFWLAECEEAVYHEVFDATYTWKFLHKMEAVWRRESGLNGLDDVLRSYDTEFPADALRAYFTSNHDENSHSGSEYERMGDAAKAFAVLCCTWNGLPLIYSGQELPNLKRLQFFDKDPIEWTGQYGLHGFYKALLALRKRSPALRAGDKAATTRRLTDGVDPYRGFAFLRTYEQHAVLIILNISNSPLFVSLEGLQVKGVFQQIFGGEALDLETFKTLELPAWGFVVLEKIVG